MKRIGAVLVMAAVLAGCHQEDPKNGAVRKAMGLSRKAVGFTGCEDRIFDNYPRFAECILGGFGGAFKALPPGPEGSNEAAMLQLAQGHPPLEIETAAMREQWPGEVKLWLGGPGGPWSVVVRQDLPARDVVIEGYGEATDKPIEVEKVHFAGR